MRALLLDAPGQLSLRELATPEPGPGELLIRVEAATTCGTDLKAWRRGHPQIPMPGPFGHEYAGVVAKAGAGARFQEGDAVMGAHSAPCGVCEMCRRGQDNLCETIMATKVLGSYAEYLLIPQRIAEVNVYAKPAGLKFAEAALLEPLACAMQAIIELKRAGTPFLPGTRALVIGPGAIGLMIATLLGREGIEVRLAGRNPERLAIGEALRIPTIPYRPEEAAPEFHIVVEATGQVEVWEASLGYVHRGGHLVLFGGPPAGTRACFDTHRLHYDQVTLLSPFHFGREAVRRAAEALPDLGLGVLVSGERTLEEADATFRDLEAGRGLKYAFRPGAPIR